jgi:hypothetical protein
MDKSHDLLPILRFNMVLLLLLTALLLLSPVRRLEENDESAWPDLCLACLRVMFFG